MKHALANPAFPENLGDRAPDKISDKARVWIVTRGPDGMLEEKIDPALLARVVDGQAIDTIIDSLIEAAADKDIAKTRVW